MQYIVVTPRQLLPSVIEGALPPRLCREIEARVPAGEQIEELRLRRSKCASVMLGIRISAVPHRGFIAST